MAEKKITNAKDLPSTQHFPLSWIKKQPRKVEDILSNLSLEEQAKHVLNLPPHLQRDLLVLCKNALSMTSIHS